jgi:DNA-binding NtrC family response regulator
LAHHSWPRNIRELLSELSFSLLHAPGNVIEMDDLPAVCRSGTTTVRGTASDFGSLARQYLSEGRTDIYRLLLADFEAQILRAAGDGLDGNQAKISERLGLARMTLRGKLREVGLIPTDS